MGLYESALILVRLEKSKKTDVGTGKLLWDLRRVLKDHNEWKIAHK